jgi:hypothetical protein
MAIVPGRRRRCRSELWRLSAPAWGVAQIAGPVLLGASCFRLLLQLPQRRNIYIGASNADFARLVPNPQPRAKSSVRWPSVSRQIATAGTKLAHLYTTKQQFSTKAPQRSVLPLRDQQEAELRGALQKHESGSTKFAMLVANAFETND